MCFIMRAGRRKGRTRAESSHATERKTSDSTVSPPGRTAQEPSRWSSRAAGWTMLTATTGTSANASLVTLLCCEPMMTHVICVCVCSSECVERKENPDVFFCCCEGNMCNKKFHYSPEMIQSEEHNTHSDVQCEAAGTELK